MSHYLQRLAHRPPAATPPDISRIGLRPVPAIREVDLHVERPSPGLQATQVEARAPERGTWPPAWEQITRWLSPAPVKRTGEEERGAPSAAGVTAARMDTFAAPARSFPVPDPFPEPSPQAPPTSAQAPRTAQLAPGASAPRPVAPHPLPRGKETGQPGPGPSHTAEVHIGTLSLTVKAPPPAPAPQAPTALAPLPPPSTPRNGASEPEALRFSASRHHLRWS